MARARLDAGEEPRSDELADPPGFDLVEARETRGAVLL